MKQSIEERRLHHQTREDRQRKAYEYTKRRILFYVRDGHPVDHVKRLEFDAARLADKLGVEN